MLVNSVIVQLWVRVTMHKLDESLGFPRVYGLTKPDLWSGDLAAVLART